MAYKLLDAAQARWRCLNAPHLVALVRAGTTFVDGFHIERETSGTPHELHPPSVGPSKIMDKFSLFIEETHYVTC